MVTILRWADNKRACGMTVRFDTGELCTISLRGAWIRVSQSRWSSLWGAVVYDETSGYVNAQRGLALAYLFPEKKVPDGVSTTSMGAFFNALLHCNSIAEVRVTLNEAIPLAERKAARSLSEMRRSEFPDWLWGQPMATQMAPAGKSQRMGDPVG